ncbi:MAG: hypothetical protein QNJ55_18280 [Xenococcus sp. MO_188.B8]|nr:hypothetical protein [Xenococcus sp. MO_188.B8]
MASPTGTQWEQAVLNKLTSNGERIAVLERDMSDVKKELTEMNKRLSGIEKTTEKIESLLGWLKWICGGIVAIALSLIANFVYSLIA